MNPVIQLLQNHRSIRRFSELAITDDLLNDLIKAGQSAATSSFIQATTVIRVTDSAMRQQFVELSGGQNYIASAAEFLVFCADLARNKHRIESMGNDAEFSWTEQFLTATVDVALFAQNVVIAAESAGLGICFIGGIRNEPDQVSDMLDLPDLVYPVFGLCLGYPQQDPKIKPRLPLSAVFHHQRYQRPGQYNDTLSRYDQQLRDYYMERSNGKLDFTFSQQMHRQSATQKRPFMRRFLNEKGFNIK